MTRRIVSAARDHHAMAEFFIGSEQLALGALTRGQLRWNYEAIFPDVYVPKAAVASLRPRIAGAWLWSGRDGVIAGRAAAALHGALWVDAATPIELIAHRPRAPIGIVARNERIDPDEITLVAGMPVTCPARTALVAATGGYRRRISAAAYPDRGERRVQHRLPRHGLG